MTTAVQNNISSEIEFIRERIRHHDHRYYCLNDPPISDYEYDRIFAELVELEKNNPDLITPESPTQRVGGKPLEGFGKVDHKVAMLSLESVKTAEGLREFDRRVRDRLTGGQKLGYIVEFKIDGVAASLRYENGILISAATRGDGSRGNDITTNIRTIKSVPLKLAGSDWPEVLEVRGEVYMNKCEFTRINQKLVAAGGKPMANPRNATAGTLKLLDSGKAAARRLSFTAYSVGEVCGNFEVNHTQMLKRFLGASIPIGDFHHSYDCIEDVIVMCKAIEGTRDSLGFQIDGMVIKVDSFAQRRQLGNSSRAPNWAVAYKFKPAEAETVVESIVVQVGKKGSLTPVANFTPVSLAGTTVRRASLHNFGMLEYNDIRVGDTVIVVKAGDIIPQIVKVIKEKRPRNSQRFSIPDKCPRCQGPVERSAEVRVRCTNPGCPAKG